MPSPASPPSAEFVLDGLAAIVGTRHVVTDPRDMAPSLREWRGLFHGAALAIVRPGNTAEVASLVRFCGENRVPVVPQGGNTGLVGGQIPDASGRAIVLSLARLDRIRDVDPVGDTMVAEAGVTLLRAQQAAAEADRLFPLSLASEGTCTIGGNLASNAGGTAMLAYGNARDLALGLEVVLPDGRLWNGLGRLRKDNTGYDLRDLFIGSEGTLGIITAAVLRLFPRPRSVVTALVSTPSPAEALALLGRLRTTGSGTVTSFELLPRFALELVTRHAVGARDPFPATHSWYVLVEVSATGREDLAGSTEAILAEAAADGLVSDAVLARSLDQQAALWLLREGMPEAQTREGGSIKHDISLPLTEVPRFVAEISAALQALVPGCRPLPYGHLGDGNLHFNVSQPVGMDKDAFMARREEVHALVYERVVALGGSISAEHGIGQMKRDLLARTKDPVALDLMRAVKQVLDPSGLMNPGKVL